MNDEWELDAAPEVRLGIGRNVRTRAVDQDHAQSVRPVRERTTIQDGGACCVDVRVKLLVGYRDRTNNDRPHRYIVDRVPRFDAVVVWEEATIGYKNEPGRHHTCNYLAGTGTT